MPLKPHIAIPPEVIIADRIIQRMPRSKRIQESELWENVKWHNPQEKEMYNEHREIALDLLLSDRYIQKHESSGTQSIYGPEYSLTHEGRMMRDAGGYIKSFQEKRKEAFFSKRVSRADGSKKIFDSKIKIAIFAMAVLASLVGIIGLLQKSSSDTQALRLKTDSISNHSIQTKPESTALISKKLHHPRNTTAQPPNVSGSQTARLQQEKKPETDVVATPPKTTGPIQTANSDNIEFKLLSAEGGIRAQTIKMTVILTTSAANWYAWSDVHSIIDPEGNEYKLKSFTNGASAYDTHIALNTDVPIKLTYTFGGVLPNVKSIKLFKFEYQHKSLDDPISVEFRDVPIAWR